MDDRDSHNGGCFSHGSHGLLILVGNEEEKRWSVKTGSGSGVRLLVGKRHQPHYQWQPCQRRRTARPSPPPLAGQSSTSRLARSLLELLRHKLLRHQLLRAVSSRRRRRQHHASIAKQLIAKEKQSEMNERKKRKKGHTRAKKSFHQLLLLFPLPSRPSVFFFSFLFLFLAFSLASPVSLPAASPISRTSLPEPTSHQPPEKKKKKQRNSPLLRSLRRGGGGSTNMPLFGRVHECKEKEH
ncbi:hypothetical protein CK203_044224 [Vitis vinifera]|uniref:Transmembrane protein n=1 Tax=Vitis vinifera TaxID=29760 RepID=A0A438GVF1_VITVI|nr:hypothetical protein CK203_044224 [Vitis vinifera]